MAQIIRLFRLEGIAYGVLSRSCKIMESIHHLTRATCGLRARFPVVTGTDTRSHRVSRLFVLVLSFAALTAPSVVNAQRVTDLRQGVRVRVDTGRPGVLIGRLESATADSIRVVAVGETLAFSLADTRSVSTSPGPDRMRGMLRTGVVTGIVGTIVGAGIGAKAFKPCQDVVAYDCARVPNTRPRAAAFGAVVFGVSSLVIGGAVGAIRGSDKWTQVPIR